MTYFEMDFKIKVYEVCKLVPKCRVNKKVLYQFK